MLILVNLIFLIAIKQIENLSGERYICDVKEQNEFANNRTIFRLLCYEDMMYLILEDKIVFLKMPRIYKERYIDKNLDSNNNNENSDQNDKDEILSYLSSQSYDMTKRMSDIEKEIVSKIVRHNISWIEDKPQLIEFYRLKSVNETVIILRKLIFKNTPGEYGLTETKLPENYIKSDYELFFENKFSAIFFEYNSFKLKISLMYKSSDKKLIKEFNLDYIIKKAIFFVDEKNEDYNTLIELDEQHNIHINHFNFSSIFESSILSMTKLAIPLVELLSCHKPFNNFSQLKGIHYHQNTFYLFVEHYYLRVNQDLANVSFLINQDRLTFKENAFDLVVPDS